jgi:hypothetical protein
MTLRRSVLIAVCALLALPAAASATTPSRAAFELSAAGKRALAARSLSLPSKPTFALGAWSVSGSAKIALRGALRFRSGKRKVSVTGLQVTIGRTSSYVTGRIGKTSLRLFTLTPTRPSVIDAPARKASMVGARFALTSAAARRLRSKLKLDRAPSTAALGRFTVGVADLTMTVPPPTTLPAPAATPAPTPTPTPSPEPGTPCDQRFAATPAGSVDWFGCDLPANGDLKSWTNYVQRPLPGPCAGPLGSVTESGGATRIVDATDHRFPVTASEFGTDGSVTITTQGTVSYLMPVHGIEESIGGLRLAIAADGKTGTVYATGAAKPFVTGDEVCTTPAAPYADRPVLTLDLTGITPQISGGVKRWIHVPARIAPGHQLIGGGFYPAGSSWGSFTIAVPER